MYWENCLVELQRYAPVTLRRPNGRWHAIWEALVRIGDDLPEEWPSQEGQTPAAAVTALWERVTGPPGYPLTIFGEKMLRVRWNGQWHEEEVPPTTASPKSAIDDDEILF